MKYHSISSGSSVFANEHINVGVGSKQRVTVTSPNIARPLTLRTSPNEYVTINQIKSFLIFNIGLLLEREKQQNVFTLYFYCSAGVDFSKNWKLMLKTL